MQSPDVTRTCTFDCRLALAAIEQTHNTSLYSELRQRLQQATGDASYSPDHENAVTFVLATNRKAAIMVSDKLVMQIKALFLLHNC